MLHTEAIAWIPLFHYLNRAKDSRTRWYAVHALTNAVITWYTCTSVMSAERFDTSTYPSPAMTIVVSLHVYHAVMYPLSQDDLFHHLLFVGLLGVPGTLFPW